MCFGGETAPYVYCPRGWEFADRIMRTGETDICGSRSFLIPVPPEGSTFTKHYTAKELSMKKWDQ